MRVAATTKLMTGIQGFDEITHGGLPRGRTTLVMGGPGCGKTVFALQSLVNGVREFNEAALFVTFEEGADQIISNASSFGWDLPRLSKKPLHLFDARLSPEIVKAGEFDLVGMLALIEQLAQAEAAARLLAVQTEMETRSAEIALLARATGSATDLIATDRAVLLGMRHADAEAVVATRAVQKKRTPRTPAKGAPAKAK